MVSCPIREPNLLISNFSNHNLYNSERSNYSLIISRWWQQQIRSSFKTWTNGEPSLYKHGADAGNPVCFQFLNDKTGSLDFQINKPYNRMGMVGIILEVEVSCFLSVVTEPPMDHTGIIREETVAQSDRSLCTVFMFLLFPFLPSLCCFILFLKIYPKIIRKTR